MSFVIVILTLLGDTFYRKSYKPCKIEQQYLGWVIVLIYWKSNLILYFVVKLSIINGLDILKQLHISTIDFNHVGIRSSESWESSSSSWSNSAPCNPEAVGQVQDYAEAHQNGKKSDGLQSEKWDSFLFFSGVLRMVAGGLTWDTFNSHLGYTDETHNN